jgi:hypothetical protein
VELYLNSPNTPSWRGAQLKHRDNFTFLNAWVFRVVSSFQVFRIKFISHVSRLSNSREEIYMQQFTLADPEAVFKNPAKLSHTHLEQSILVK